MSLRIWLGRVGAGVGLACWGCALAAAAEPVSFDRLSGEYRDGVLPLTKSVCLECHSTEKSEGELDLERFSSLADVRRGVKTWLKVAEMLDNGEMPPKDAARPLSADERRQLRGWIERYLHAEAYAQAGDPGPVVLRRLNNAEYTYTIRDLLGVGLSPAREFPADGAAGEGFTNTGGSLVMSPALLTKYLDAGKEVARHAVLLSDGLQFSPSTTPRDWTDERLARIQALYRRHAALQGGTKVNLQGIVFDTNQGGRLAVAEFLAATIAERDALAAGQKTIDAVAAERGLNAKYLGLLWQALVDARPSLLLDGLRQRWRGAKPEDAPAIAADIAAWQAALVKFQNVGHMKSWMAPVNPLAARQEIRLPIAAPAAGNEATLYLCVAGAGDAAAGNYVVWQQPRLVTPGRPDLLLRDLRPFTRQMLARRERVFSSAAKCLSAAAEASRAGEPVAAAELAARHQVDADALAAWLDYLGIGSGTTLQLDYFTGRIERSGNYDFVQGWGSNDTPLLVANSSDQHVRVPGNLKPHGVCVHPSPTLNAAVGWRSPISGVLRIAGQVTHAHPECGNGVTWSLELRRGATRQRLADGVSQGGGAVAAGPIESLAVQQGDLVSLLIGPRDGNHGCDLTDLELVLTSAAADGREWSLTRDVSPHVLAGNPQADSFGNAGVWHFYTEPVQAGAAGPVIPAGSLLARWQSAPSDDQKRPLAEAVQKLLVGSPPADASHPDAVLYRQLASLGGPLFAGARLAATTAAEPSAGASDQHEPGLDPARFGRHPSGAAIDAASLCVEAPAVIEIRLPADLVAGSQFVTTAVLDPASGGEGSAQVQVLTTKPESRAGLRADLPILVADGSDARARIERAFDDFRGLFPPALCYYRIVPVDEVITLTLFHREDEPFCRLMLSEAEKAELDRLWDELHWVSQDALTVVDAFYQLLEYASQDSDPKLFEPFRVPIHERAAAFRQQLLDAEPRQVEALLDFAARAYRRPLSDAESRALRELYARLRGEDLPHDEALRLTLARAFVSPAFLYRLEKAAPGAAAGPVSDWELASRLSYFLWSSAPDAELREAAAAGRLRDPDVLAAQARRMLGDDRVRRLATEFACQWLHVYEFDALDEKSERHFPTFAALKADMYEESIRFFADMFQHDGSVRDILEADHTFVNEALAAHYGILGISGPQWRRVDGMRQYGRGGILGMATVLAKQSGASRTSPILRGNWVSEVLLGEKLPRPPKDVPRLPEDETATAGLTVRQLVEKHSSDERCAKCHVRIDHFGYSLEGYDAIGRRRDKDLADRPIDTHAKLQDGTEFTGLDGLRTYLATARRDAVLNQFCRKLLGYALGRAVQLSDEPLLAQMREQLEKDDYRFAVAVETVVRSQQFRYIRGIELAEADAP